MFLASTVIFCVASWENLHMCISHFYFYIKDHSQCKSVPCGHAACLSVPVRVLVYYRDQSVRAIPEPKGASIVLFQVLEKLEIWRKD